MGALLKLFYRSINIILVLLISFNSCKTSNTAHQTKNDFVQIFDGKSLQDWEGDSTYWRVENGCMVGEVTAATILKRNSFIIWRGGLTKDFEIKVDYLVSAGGNSGINYRSEEVKDVPHALRGYQADIDGANLYTGQNYEERGRTFLALRGQKVLLQTNQKPFVSGSLGDSIALLGHIKINDWNSYHLVVKGNHMQHYINGVLMSEVTDNDTVNRKFSGLLGVQVHVGPPMKISYRNFLLKENRD